MNVDLLVQLGIRGPLQSLNSLPLDASAIGATSSWAGSYHVLSMGRHYNDYAITDHVRTLTAIAGFQAAEPYVRLASKARAPSVTANIGEAIAAIFARDVLNAKINDIVHIGTKGVRRAPDYLMKLAHLMPGPFSEVISSGIVVAGPAWWPVESKARRTQDGLRDAQADGLAQIVAYWSALTSSEPSAVGYGMIVAYAYQWPQQQVRVSLLLPRNQAQLLEALQASDQTNQQLVRDCLYEC